MKRNGGRLCLNEPVPNRNRRMRISSGTYVVNSNQLCYDEIMLLLTGEPNIGKSTVIRYLISLIGQRRCGGFYTNEIRDRYDRRVGFKTVTLSGKQFLLAHNDIRSDYQIEEFKVNLSDVEDIAVSEILHNEKEYLIIDEIGRMQLFSPKFRKTVRDLSGKKNVIATISLQDTRLTKILKEDPNNVLYTLTLDNRDEMPFVMAKELFKDDEMYLSKVELSQKYHEEMLRFTYESDKVILDSTHDIRIITKDEKGYHCTCDYYMQTGTCSHIMALVRNNIARLQHMKF